jgi:hypothetical protein
MLTGHISSQHLTTGYLPRYTMWCQSSWPTIGLIMLMAATIDCHARNRLWALEYMPYCMPSCHPQTIDSGYMVANLYYQQEGSGLTAYMASLSVTHHRNHHTSRELSHGISHRQDNLQLKCFVDVLGLRHVCVAHSRSVTNSAASPRNHLGTLETYPKTVKQLPKPARPSPDFGIPRCGTSVTRGRSLGALGTIHCHVL